MPTYEYESEDGKITQTLIRSLDERDKRVIINGVSLKRVTAPRVAVVGFASNPADMRTSVLKGYYKEECRGGRFRSSFTKQQIKRAWSQPD